MKRKLILVLCLVLLLVACSKKVDSNSDEEENDDRFISDIKHLSVTVITDTETGCNYIHTKRFDSGGLSPLYDSDGNIDCGN